jgi:hypothetical protein
MEQGKSIYAIDLRLHHGGGSCPVRASFQYTTSTTVRPKKLFPVYFEPEHELKGIYAIALRPTEYEFELEFEI